MCGSLSHRLSHFCTQNWGKHPRLYRIYVRKRSYLRIKISTGIKVIDMTNNFADPMASALLADYDAEVIHIEKPITGDDNRFFMPMVDGTSFSHMSSNRRRRPGSGP